MCTFVRFVRLNIGVARCGARGVDVSPRESPLGEGGGKNTKQIRSVCGLNIQLLHALCIRMH